MLQEFPDKSGTAECRIALKTPGNEPIIFTGICEGNIVPPRGQTNFGWDPIFEPKEQNQTFAEMPMEAKNEISHRGHAMKQLLEYFRNNPDWFNKTA